MQLEVKHGSLHTSFLKPLLLTLNLLPVGQTPENTPRTPSGPQPPASNCLPLTSQTSSRTHTEDLWWKGSVESDGWEGMRGGAEGLNWREGVQ